MSSRRLALAALGGVNLCSGMLHLAFDGVLRSGPSPYGRLLVVENAMVAFAFLGFGLVLWCGRARQIVRAATVANVTWWLALAGEVWLVRPYVTTVTLIAPLSPASQTAVIVVGAGAAVLLGLVTLAPARDAAEPDDLVVARDEQSRDA